MFCIENFGNTSQEWKQTMHSPSLKLHNTSDHSSNIGNPTSSKWSQKKTFQKNKCCAESCTGRKGKCSNTRLGNLWICRSFKFHRERSPTARCRELIFGDSCRFLKGQNPEKIDRSILRTSVLPVTKPRLPTRTSDRSSYCESVSPSEGTYHLGRSRVVGVDRRRKLWFFSWWEAPMIFKAIEILKNIFLTKQRLLLFISLTIDQIFWLFCRKILKHHTTRRENCEFQECQLEIKWYFFF